MLVLLLGATTVKTTLKGVKMFRKETAAMAGPKATQQPLLAYPGVEDVEVPAGDCCRSYRTELDNLLEVESRHSVPKVLVMLGVTLVTLAFTILKGGSTINLLNVTCGTPKYWVLSFAVVPFTLLVGFFARRHLIARYYLKERVGFEYAEGDVEWDERHTVVYPLTCSVAGLCAGLFGIGGGIVKGPLMLEMGTLPQVASATSATMIMFTSSAATVSYLLFDSLNTQYAKVLFPLGFVCTLIGQIALNALIKRLGRSSLIVLCIGAIIGLSTVAMGIESSGGLIDLFRGIPEPHKSLC